MIDNETRDRAYKFALSSLSHSDSSKNALYNKLLLRGFDKETAKAALDYVLSFGYINEEGQIEKIATELCTRKCFGKRKIVSRLLSKGYPRDLIFKTIFRLTESGELDFLSARERLLSKYDGLSYEEQMKILYKYGFTNV